MRGVDLFQYINNSFIIAAGRVVNSCYSCVDVKVQTDLQNGQKHTDRCNYYSNPVQRCGINEVIIEEIILLQEKRHQVRSFSYLILR